MKQRPILFSGPMVRALLDGSKTQTRRVCKPAIKHSLSYVIPVQDPAYPGQRPPHITPGWFGDEEGDIQFYSPYGQPGDQLWVRETWARTVVGAGTAMVVYREGDNRTDYGGPWKPGIHMFQRDSRITLEITGVRVERLHDITRGDAMAEGCPFPNMADGDDPRKWYSDLWNSINGTDSWDLNPWVWVIEFKAVKP